MNVLQSIVNRLGLILRATTTYNGNRNLYNALGYNTNPTFEDIYAKYLRNGYAHAIINRIINATWYNGYTVIEADDKETAFERDFERLKDINIDEVFRIADTLALLGNYSIIVLGFNDVVTQDSWSKEVRKGSKLLYIKAIPQSSVTITKYNTDRYSKDFGAPELYNIEFTQANNSYNLNVHRSRVIHIAYNTIEDDFYGNSILLPLYNRLDDLEKLIGGAAEMFWRGARPGYHADTKDGFALSDEDIEKIKEQLTEYENDLRRFLATSGVEIKSLPLQIASPKEHVDVIIEEISAATGIPRRILTGSERGELASSQDKIEYADYISSRRETIKNKIILKFIDRLVEYKAISEYKDDITIKFTSLYEQSDKEKAEIAKTYATAIKEYFAAGLSEDLLPFDAFLEYILKIDPVIIDIIKQLRQQEYDTEQENI